MIEFEKYEKILIGIGDTFNEQFESKDDMDNIRRILDSDNPKLASAYEKLNQLVSDKDYYIVSTCTDGRIYQSSLDSEKIVTPCGGYNYLQCPDDCAHELLPFERYMLEDGKWPTCPHCGKACVFNKLPMENYNEGGYIEKWEKYNKWMQSTINKSLLILELGVGMTYPTVIRFAFEKMAMFNKKADMYRVHPTLAFSTPEIKDKCTCVMGDAMEFLMGL